jgi:hypothetical protein
MLHIECYGTLSNLQDKEFSYQPQATFNYMHFVMQIGHNAEILDVQLQDIVYFLETHQYLERRRSKQQYPVLQLKQNIELWPQPAVKLPG